jgi:hypothetical protein
MTAEAAVGSDVVVEALSLGGLAIEHLRVVDDGASIMRVEPLQYDNLRSACSFRRGVALLDGLQDLR